MSQLLITLPIQGLANAGTELAYALVAGSGALSSHGSAAPALLPRADAATLIVPAQRMSWHLASLPAMPRGSSAQKMQAMLAGVLEEQLLDDPAALHLMAFPSLQTGGADGKRTWVAACDKAYLQDAITILQAARVPLARIAPQSMPLQTSALHASGAADEIWLHLSDAQGVMCLPLAQAAILPQLPEDLAVTAEPAVAAQVEAVLRQRVHVLQAPQWAAQAAQTAQALGIDFAQGDLAVAGSGRAWQVFTGFLGSLVAAPAWRPVRYGLGLLLLANVVGLQAWAWKQNAQLQDKRAQMNQLLKQSFPNVSVVLDAPLQMQRELANLRQAQGQLSGRDFESIYGRFSGIAGMNTAPAAIDFVANEVQIRGSGLEASQLDALLARFQFAALDVRSNAQALTVSHRDASRLQAAPSASSAPTPAGAKP